MIDSVIYFSQTALKMKLCHVGQVLNTHNASGEMVEKSVGQWLYRTKGKLLASQSEGAGGERWGVVFKWGLEVGR